MRLFKHISYSMFVGFVMVAGAGAGILGATMLMASLFFLGSDYAG